MSDIDRDARTRSTSLRNAEGARPWVRRADGPHTPGFHVAASRLLANDRDVLGVGVETVGTDAGQAASYALEMAENAGG